MKGIDNSIFNLLLGLDSASQARALKSLEGNVEGLASGSSENVGEFLDVLEQMGAEVPGNESEIVSLLNKSAEQIEESIPFELQSSQTRDALAALRDNAVSSEDMEALRLVLTKSQDELKQTKVSADMLKMFQDNTDEKNLIGKKNSINDVLKATQPDFAESMEKVEKNRGLSNNVKNNANVEDESSLLINNKSSAKPAAAMGAKAYLKHIDEQLSIMSGKKPESESSFDSADSVSNVSDSSEGFELNFEGGQDREDSRISTLTPKVQAVSKAFNLSQLGNVSRENVIDQISNYLTTQSLVNKDTVEMTVNHHDLGEFSIKAAKNADMNDISLDIVTRNNDARSFFKVNEGQLLKALSDSGVKVGEFKVISNGTLNASETGFLFKDDFGGQQDPSGNKSGTHQFGRQDNGGKDFSDQGRQRRQEMWQYAKQQMAA